MSEHAVPIETKPSERGTEGRPAVLAELPILPLREAVLFPQAVIPLAVARTSSVRLVDEAVIGARLVGVVLQR